MTSEMSEMLKTINERSVPRVIFFFIACRPSIKAKYCSLVFTDDDVVLTPYTKEPTYFKRWDDAMFALDFCRKLAKFSGWQFTIKLA